MTQIPDNDPFGINEAINAANHELDGTFPGMPDLIKELNYQDLGRLIVRSPYPKTQGLLDIMIRGSDSMKPMQEQIGYILPLNHEQTEHLTLFVNGHMYVTAARIDGGSVHATYGRHFQPGTTPDTVFGDNLAEAECHFVEVARDCTTNIVMNTDPKQVEQIRRAEDRAMTISREVKLARDRAVAETASSLIENFTQLLNPNLKHQEPGQ